MNRLELFGKMKEKARNTDMCSYILCGLYEYNNLSDALRIFTKNALIMGLYRSINQQPYDQETNCYYVCVSDEDRVVIYFTGYDWYRDIENKEMIIRIALDREYTYTELYKFNVTDFFDHSTGFTVDRAPSNCRNVYERCGTCWKSKESNCEYDTISNNYIMMEPLNVFNSKKYYQSNLFNSVPEILKPYIALYLFNCSPLVKPEYEDIFTNIYSTWAYYGTNLIISDMAIAYFSDNDKDDRLRKVMNVFSFISIYGDKTLDIFERVSSNESKYFRSLGKIMYDDKADYVEQLFGWSWSR